jgi:hypothetical protein
MIVGARVGAEAFVVASCFLLPGFSLSHPTAAQARTVACLGPGGVAGALDLGGGGGEGAAEGIGALAGAQRPDFGAEAASDGLQSKVPAAVF